MIALIAKGGVLVILFFAWLFYETVSHINRRL
jgi:hypothetical protein